ncbi:MAG TPA: hypothetical protein VGS41_13875 [Chthonomonadales bacterium]|nr:hypothetical protein [Chthonomonadales bacterium]
MSTPRKLGVSAAGRGRLSHISQESVGPEGPIAFTTNGVAHGSGDPLVTM